MMHSSVVFTLFYGHGHIWTRLMSYFVVDYVESKCDASISLLKAVSVAFPLLPLVQCSC
ncbi:hypothetical protein CDL12_08801 [Handroanthus impetiginosus]|uniref:Uncharacterized protein n=1 Tax=Handroanthus impetiginosus TaxID=429701 RepID=A0A2G9HLY9_9LAMI|nr:hypothetical protein CDL12_08801 [Handroanthus impetiginosus]